MNSSNVGPIVVFGASGAQGGPVARLLLAEGRATRVIARSRKSLAELEQAGAEPHPLDLGDSDALTRALEGAAGAFVHFPFVPVVDLQRSWAMTVSRALLAAQVPIAVFSSSGPVPGEVTGVSTLDSKLAADEALRAGGAPLVFLQPAIYLGNVAAPFSAPSVVEADELRYPPFPSQTPMPFISVEDQARIAIAALGRPDLIGRTLRIGAQLTGAELASQLSVALDRTIAHVPMSPAELGRAVLPLMGPEAADILTEDYEYIAARPAALGLDRETDSSHQELGVQLTPVSTWAKDQPWQAMAELGGGHAS